MPVTACEALSLSPAIIDLMYKSLDVGPCSPQFSVGILKQNLSVNPNFPHPPGCIYCGLDCVLLGVIGTVKLVIKANLPFIIGPLNEVLFNGHVTQSPTLEAPTLQVL